MEKSLYDVSLQTASYLVTVLSSEAVVNIEPIVNGKETVMFIVNYQNGWAVLSGDKRTVPILANSIKGPFNSEIDNPESAIWFNEAANKILSLKRNNPPIVDKMLLENKDFNFWMKEEGLSLDDAMNRGLYDGKTETKTIEDTSSNFIMNWGWSNSSYNYQEYSPYTTIWSAGGYNFKYERKIYYNIRKNN